jgi:hypothetical protein
MPVARRLLLATAFAAVVAPGGWAQESPRQAPLPNAILLARSWDEAIKEAKIRNVPIFFSTILAV